MKVEKLLKRFLKEAGIYGSNKSKEILTFVDDYEEAIIPFNAFRWDTTKEGHNYWYVKALEWVAYLHDNLDNIDTDEKTSKDISIKSIKNELCELLRYYCLEGSNEEELSKIESWKNANELYKMLHEQVKEENSQYSVITTVSYTTA